MAEIPAQPDRKERLGTPTSVVIFCAGGTWNDEKEEGRLVGKGNLDDKELFDIETSLALHTNFDPESIKSGERRLAEAINARMLQARSTDAAEVFTWAVNDKGESLTDYISGSVVDLFNGQSSHLRPSLVAPMICIF